MSVDKGGRGHAADGLALAIEVLESLDAELVERWGACHETMTDPAAEEWRRAGDAYRMEAYAIAVNAVRRLIRELMDQFQ